MLPHRSYCWQQAKLFSITGNSSLLNSARIFFFVLSMMLYLSNVHRLEQSKKRRCFVREESMIFQSCSYPSSQLAFKALVMTENWKRSCGNDRKSWIQQQHTHCSPWTWRRGDWELPLHYVGEVFFFVWDGVFYLVGWVLVLIIPIKLLKVLQEKLDKTHCLEDCYQM